MIFAGSSAPGKPDKVLEPGAGSTAPEGIEHMRLMGAASSCETFLMMDTCAGGSIFPRGFDQGAQDDLTVGPVQLATATWARDRTST